MNLLVTGAFAWTKDELNRLKQLGHDVIFMQQENDNLPCEASWVEGVVANGIFLRHPIEMFTSLRYIQLTSAGYDRVSMDYVKEHNISIFNARGVYSIPMAEFALSGVLEFCKQCRFFDENQKRHRWIKHRGIWELYGKTVCIVGCGSVGTECAKRFEAFGCRVIGIDVNPYEAKYYETILSLDRLNDVLCMSDVVVLTLPLTKQTKHLMNTEQIARLRAGAILVNIARGGIIHEQALVKALQEERISAVLDVFEDEPLHEKSVLWDMENVIITPHNSFVGDGNHKRMLDVIYRNLEAVK